MRAIWKYPIPGVRDIVQFEMPRGARALSVHLQDDHPMIWALVDPNAPRETVTFRIVGTGHLFDPENYQYVGTFQHPPFVWHLWQRVEG